jgi:hypothetical protein
MVKLSLHSINPYDASPFLISTLDDSEWSASRPCRFIPGTHGIGGWVGPRADLEAVTTELLIVQFLESVANYHLS